MTATRAQTRRRAADMVRNAFGLSRHARRSFRHVQADRVCRSPQGQDRHFAHRPASLRERSSPMLAQRAGDARAGADESHDDLVSGRTNRPTTRPGSGPKTGMPGSESSRSSSSSKGSRSTARRYSRSRSPALPRTRASSGPSSRWMPSSASVGMRPSPARAAVPASLVSVVTSPAWPFGDSAAPRIRRPSVRAWSRHAAGRCRAWPTRPSRPWNPYS